MFYKSFYCFLYITKIFVSPENPSFFDYKNQFIMKKSSNKNKKNNCLVFCVRNIKTVTIPNFIEHICSYAFCRCNCIKKLHFQQDSKHKSIGEFAFAYTSFKSISIPFCVTQIAKNAFLNCDQIEIIEINYNFKMEFIDKYKFKNFNNLIIMAPPEPNKNVKA